MKLRKNIEVRKVMRRLTGKPFCEKCGLDLDAAMKKGEWFYITNDKDFTCRKCYDKEFKKWQKAQLVLDETGPQENFPTIFLQVTKD